MRSTSSPPPMILLIFLSAISILPMNMFVPAMPRMAEDLGASYALMNLAVSGFALMTAAVHLASGALSDRYGRRPVALGALIIFTIASIGCLFAHRIDLFLLFRMLQGVIVAVYAASLASIRDTSEPTEVRRRIGTLTSAFAVAPLVGPTIGGALSTYFQWRSNFLVFALIGALAFVLTWIGFKETHVRRTGPLQLKESYRALLASTKFRAYTACMAFSISTFYIFVGVAPRVAESLGDPSPTRIGILMGLVTGGFVVGSTITSRIRADIHPWELMLAGRGIAVIGPATALGLLVLWQPSLLFFFVPCILIGVGNGLAVPSANARVLTLGGQHAGTALGLANSMTITTAAILSAFAGLAADSDRPQIWVLLTLLTVAGFGLLAAVHVYRLETKSQPQIST